MVVKEGSSFVFVFLELLKQGDKNQTPRPSDWLLSHTTLDCELYVVLTMLASCYFFFLSLPKMALSTISHLGERIYVFICVCACFHMCAHMHAHMCAYTRGNQMTTWGAVLKVYHLTGTGLLG